jgi:serine/threonine protein kinase
MFEALTGEPPVKEGTTVETLYKHIAGTIPRISQLHQELNVPTDIEALVARALVNDVEKRYQSASEMLEDLARVDLEKISLPKAAYSGVEPRSKTNTKLEKSSQSVKVKWLLTLVCALFLSIVLCVYVVPTVPVVPVVSPSPDGSFQLNAKDAQMKGKPVGDLSVLILQPLTDNTVSWDILVPENRTGQFTVDAVYACFSDTAGSTITLKIDNRATGCLGIIESTKDWHDFTVHHWKGVLTLRAGRHVLAIDPNTNPEKAILNLSCLKLNPLTP